MKVFKELKPNWQLVGLCLFVIIIWMFFPFLFKKLMSWMSWMSFNGGDVNTFASLGPIGDIYGSLNTLFTSATLAIVVYSTLLQRQANKDAKDAMAQQLQQARDAADEQLKQAKDATTQQLALAQASHDAQIKESQYAIFSNMFNNLLIHKNESKKSLTIRNDGEIYDHEHIFNHMYKQFLKRVESDWSQINKITRLQIMEDFLKSINELSNALHVQTLLITYFNIYESIFDLVKSSVLTKQEKDFYYLMVGNTMSLSEQACLLWVATGFEEFAKHLEDTGIFWFNFEKEVKFIYEFHQRSYFRNTLFLKVWDEFAENQTPT